MRPAQSTIDALRAAKEGISYRELARKLGYTESIIGTLNDILTKDNVRISLERENQLREKLDLPRITESGSLVRPRLDRPYASVRQRARKDGLGASWNEVIDLGLDRLEELARLREIGS